MAPATGTCAPPRPSSPRQTIPGQRPGRPDAAFRAKQQGDVRVTAQATNAPHSRESRGMIFSPPVVPASHAFPPSGALS